MAITERILLEVEGTAAFVSASAAVRQLDKALASLGSSGGGGKGLADAAAAAARIAPAKEKALAATTRETAEQRALVAATNQEVRLAAQLATFDGEREKRLHAIRSELDKQKKLAQGKDPSGLGPALPRTLESQIGSTLASLATGQALGNLASGAVQAIGRAALDVAKAGADLALEMATFKDDTMDAFTASLGSARLAEQAFKDGLRLANEIGGQPTERLKQLRELLGKGFSESQALDVIKGLADLNIRLPDMDSAGLQDALAKIANKGELSSRALAQLNDVGFSSEEIFAQLGKRMGKTAAEVEALMKAGKVSGNEGIAAVLDLIKVKTGEANLGDIAKQNASDVGALIERLKGAPAALFLSADGAKGADAFGDGLKRVLALLDPTTREGERLTKAIGDLENGLGGLAGSEAVTLAIDGALSLLAGVARGAGKGLQDMQPALDATGKVMAIIAGSSGDAGSGVELVTRAIVDLVAAVGIAAAVAAAPFIAIYDSVLNVIGLVESLSNQAEAAGMHVGNAIVNGIIIGLTGGLGLVGAAASDLASSAVSSAKSQLDSHSPSRVFVEIGDFAAQGLAIGLSGGVPLVGRAAAGLAAASAASVANTVGGPVLAPLGGAAGAGSSGPVVLHVHFDAGATAALGAGGSAALQSAATSLRTEMDAYFRAKAAAAGRAAA